MTTLKAPFPWFGGKSRAAPLVWAALGDVSNYVEPFAGSLAVLLGRPSTPRVETINDADCYVANFWRALAAEPDTVARLADWPVNEADLHARHAWLVGRAEFRERMKIDPDFYDAKVAAWWAWGLSQWIGSGWCDLKRNGASASHRKRPIVAGDRSGNGVHSAVARQLPLVGGWRIGCGVHQGEHASGHASLASWFGALRERLRSVRVCCGDWSRVVTPTVLRNSGVTGVVLDPPYSHDERDPDLYACEDEDVAASCREWAIAHGSDPALRIVLCGYDREHSMPRGWRSVEWKATGGYGNQRKEGTNDNAKRERLWLSPHCLGDEALPLFAGGSR